MLRFLFGFNWRKSKSHLLLLSKFLQPRTIDDYPNWENILGESSQKAIKRFVDEGMLEKANLNAQLDYKFKITELKAMLKQYGLPVSGRKEDLINRIIQVDLEGMKKIVSGMAILLCSDRGREIAEKYLTLEKTKRKKLETQVLEYIKQRKFKEASITVAAYESEQVFLRGIGIDWKNYNPTRDIEMLKFIFGGKPKILSLLNDDQLTALRPAAGMIYLLGTNQGKEWLPSNFETGLVINNDAAIRMLLFYASNQTHIANYRQSGVIEQVEIVSAQNSCEACKKISGKKFKLNNVLELPYEHCTHEMGCRCRLISVVEI